MKAILALLLFAGTPFVAAAQSQPATQSKPPVSIVISTGTPIVKAGAPVTVKIRLTNTSDHDISLSQMYSRSSSFDRGVDISYEQDIRDSKSNLVKRGGQSQPEPPINGFSVLHTLKPGESMDSLTTVSGRYDVSHPGTYAIQLSRTVSGSVVKSNAMTVTVTP